MKKRKFIKLFRLSREVASAPLGESLSRLRPDSVQFFSQAFSSLKRSEIIEKPGMTALEFLSQTSVNQLEESIQFVRTLFNNSNLDISKLTLEDMREFLRRDLQVPIDDVEMYFEKILEKFNTKTVEQKIEVFVQIFDQLIGKPVAQTDKKWLKDYLEEEYQVGDPKLLKDAIEAYDKASVMQKLNIIVGFDHLLIRKNGTTRLAFSIRLIFGAIFLLIISNIFIPLVVF